MINNWDKCFNLVIKSEGGFSDDPRDKGNKLPDGRPGSTMLGCTQANWEAYVGHKVTHDDMRKLTPSDVKPLYKKNYWDQVKGDLLPLGTDYEAFDFAINAGPNTSRKLLQRAVNVPDDGIIGPQTLAAVQKFDQISLIKNFSEAKRAYYKSLDTFPIYGKGWLNRVSEVEKVALSMVG